MRDAYTQVATPGSLTETSMQLSQLAIAVVVLPGAITLWRLFGSLLDKFCTRKFTVLYDIDHLGPAHARPDEKRIKGTAVICGGRYVH